MLRLSAGVSRTALVTAGVTAAGLVAAVGLHAAPVAAAVPPHTVAPGTVWAWGVNSAAEVDPTSPDGGRPTPIAVPGLPQNVVQVSGARTHAFALLADGTVRAWGSNNEGEYGNGTTSPTSPLGLAQPTGLSGITQIAAGTFGGFAIGAGGIVYGWGLNDVGQIGDGTTTQRLTPVQVPGLSGITQIAAGLTSTYALASDGTVWSWGDRILGDGLPQRLRPAKVAGLTGITQLAMGAQFMLALRSDGTVLAWGANDRGQLGLGPNAASSYLTPQQIVNLTGIRIEHLAAGIRHALAVDDAGRVWAWGDDQFGELGDGHGDGSTVITRTWPVLVPGATGVVQVAAGGGASAALHSDGTVLAWGVNADEVRGILGIDSTSLNVNTPSVVVGRDSVTQLAMSNNTMFAITPGVAEPYGFVYADNASPALGTPYNPSAHYAFDSAGGRVAVTRTGTGAYTVDFPGLSASGLRGTVQLTAFGNTANHCKRVGWDLGLRITVSCLTPAGAPADTRFVAQYFSSGGSQHMQAYLADQAPTATAFTPANDVSFNSRRQANIVTRTGVGQYVAHLTFMNNTGNDSVTAYGTGGTYCTLGTVSVAAVGVNCYTMAGAPADDFWELRFTDLSVADNDHPGAYVWANDRTAASYTPTISQWNSTGGTITITRSATGSYRVDIPGLADVNATSAMVTSVGSDSDYCAVNGWSPSADGTGVNVVCHNPAGAPADAFFFLNYLTNF